MIESNNTKVQSFLEDIELTDHDKFLMLEKMRAIVFRCLEGMTERMMYGGIMFTLGDDDFGGLFVRKNHISFEFSNGYLMEDPSKMLEGKGKYRRHIKIRTMDDIESKRVEYFVKQVR